MPPVETVDIAWLLFCAALVLLMQAGFTALESGLVRSKNSINLAIKKFANFLIAAALFWLIGFGLMFGSDDGGLVGSSSFLFESDSAFLTAFFLFQRAKSTCCGSSRPATPTPRSPSSSA